MPTASLVLIAALGLSEGSSSLRASVASTALQPENVADCWKESDLGKSYNGLKHTAESGFECVNWMNADEKTPGNNIF